MTVPRWIVSMIKSFASEVFKLRHDGTMTLVPAELGICGARLTALGIMTFVSRFWTCVSWVQANQPKPVVRHVIVRGIRFAGGFLG